MACAGDTASSGQGQTQQEQVDWYSLVYSIVENSIDTGYSIKGVAFWRWDAAVSPTAALAPFDNAATISTHHLLRDLQPRSPACVAVMCSGAQTI